MNRLVARALFPEAPAARPAVLRVLVGAYCLWYVGRRYRMLMEIARSDPALFRPVGAAAVHPRPIPPGLFRQLLHATLLANLAFLLGWRHRVAGPAFSGLLLWLLSYRNSWSMIFHNDNALVLHALLLGVGPAADVLSLDALPAGGARGASPAALRAWLGRDAEGGWRTSWHYGWPVRLMNTAMLLIYFVSGVAKVAGPLGWGWASGEALRRQVAVDGLRKELFGGEPAPASRLLRGRIVPFRLFGIGSLVIELAAPLVLADRRLARLWAVAAWQMHWGILLVMGITFRYQLSGLLFAPFFEVERLVAWLDRAPAQTQEERCPPRRSRRFRRA